MKKDEGTKARARIFLVDDDPGITMTFKACLEGQGFVVDAFNDSILALSKFKTDTYALLLLDIKMPKMNGFELYREIEKIDNKTKVCFITAFVVYYESLREIFPMTKISCFIKKPVELQDLARMVTLELEQNPSNTLLYSLQCKDVEH